MFGIMRNHTCIDNTKLFIILEANKHYKSSNEMIGNMKQINGLMERFFNRLMTFLGEATVYNYCDGLLLYFHEFVQVFLNGKSNAIEPFRYTHDFWPLKNHPFTDYGTFNMLRFYVHTLAASFMLSCRRYCDH